MNMTREQSGEIQEALGAVLTRVIDPVTGISIAGLGLVERFRLQPERRRLLVFCRHVATHHACCIILDNLAFEDTLERLRAELGRTFPDLTVHLRFAE
jgi:metal-sulfur cluster biosynthetic enzyme